MLVLIGRDVFILFKGDILCLIEKEKCVVYDHQTSRSSFLHIPLKSLKDSNNEISTHDWWTFPSNLYSKFQIILYYSASRIHGTFVELLIGIATTFTLVAVCRKG